MSWSRRRLPRVGARMRIAAIASAGEARDGAGGRASISSCIEARVLARGAPKITERRAASRFTGIPTLAVAMTRNRKRSRSRTPPPAAKGGGFSRCAQVWLATLGTVVGVATGMVALANNVLPKHSDDAEATPSPVVQQTVGSICDDVNRHDADRVSDAKLLHRRLRPGRTALQVRDALLESYQRTLRNAEHDETRLAALHSPRASAATQRAAARAWTNNLERLRGIVAALDDAGTWAKLRRRRGPHRPAADADGPRRLEGQDRAARPRRRPVPSGGAARLAPGRAAAPPSPGAHLAQAGRPRTGAGQGPAGHAVRPELQAGRARADADDHHADGPGRAATGDPAVGTGRALAARAPCGLGATGPGHGPGAESRGAARRRQRPRLAQAQPAGAVVEHRRAPPAGRAVGRADRRRLAGAQHDLAADRDRRVGVELAVAAQHDARHEAVGERGARLQAVAVGVEDVHLRRAEADRLARVVDDPPEQQMVGGGLADGRRARRRLPPQRAAGLRGVPAEPARGEHREDRHDRRDAEDPSHVASLERTGVRDLAHFAAEIDGDRASSGHRA